MAERNNVIFAVCSDFGIYSLKYVLDSSGLSPLSFLSSVSSFRCFILSSPFTFRVGTCGSYSLLDHRDKRLIAFLENIFCATDIFGLWIRFDGTKRSYPLCCSGNPTLRCCHCKPFYARVLSIHVCVFFVSFHSVFLRQRQRTIRLTLIYSI